MLKISIFLSMLVFLNSCNTFSEANKILRNEKIKSTDEFLVEKRDPLIYTPDFEKIPEPGSKKKAIASEKDKIKKMLKAPIEKDASKTNSSSIEDSILDKIRK